MWPKYIRKLPNIKYAPQMIIKVKKWKGVRRTYDIADLIYQSLKQNMQQVQINDSSCRCK